jgi:hypothetical protein
MQMQKSEALKLKCEALKWLRLRRRCAFIATEVGNFSADVLGISEKRMIEVEVKQNLVDLRNDFQKQKHSNYLQAHEMPTWERQWIPNAFYFAVTDDLVEPAKELLQRKRADRYGIIALSGFRVVKMARKLHDRPPSSHAKFICALRMGSELIRFHEAWL